MTDSAYGVRRDAAAPHKYDVRPRLTSEVRAFWVALAGGAWGCPLTVVSPGGTEAIAIFSGEEEAKMFCLLRDDEGANPIIRQTTAGGILSLLYCPRAAKHVSLDPLPEVLGRGLSGTLALERERFARRFAGVGSEPAAPRAGAQGTIAIYI